MRYVLLVHDSIMQSALYAIACRSVHLSVHHTGGPIKTVEVRVMQFSAIIHSRVSDTHPLTYLNGGIVKCQI